MAQRVEGAILAMLMFPLFLYVTIGSATTGNTSWRPVPLKKGANLTRSPCVPMLVSMPKPTIIPNSPDQFRGKLRLPHFAKPRHYELRFHPNLVTYTFSGVVEITIDILEPTHFLVLNVVNITINQASINFKCLTPIEVVFFTDDQIMVLGFGKELPLGEGVLRMHFYGTLSDDKRGFYRSKYQYKGKMTNMAVTQFEALDARRCFPCWDEPAFKAKFNITLEITSDLVALSNMPVSSEMVSGPVKTIHFEESPLMSTYLVAMVVGIFEFVEGVTTQGTKVRVYTEVGKSEHGKFALDVGVKLLDLYNDFFGTPYALPKMDMIAIPDFSSMGMENYGLVTFDGLDLLLYESRSAPTKQREIAVTVAHELAHQWCGNLVTIEWWNHLWLSEGCATWMSYQAIDYLFPQWNIWMEFLEVTISTLRLDSIDGSHPIEVEIQHINEIEGIFDDIIYIKGASIFRMLQSYLGTERFQKALASYIKKYAYSNANTEDLWAAFEVETGEPFKDMMSSWMKQPGYPVINAQHDGKGIKLGQDPFWLDGSSRSSLWDVPITLSCASSQEKFLLKQKYEKLDSCGKREMDGNLVIKLNINETGFYRVKYDKKIAATLQTALEANMFSSMEKIGIVENSLALSMSRKDTLSSLLCILYACREDDDYSVLTHIKDITSIVAKITRDAMPNLAGDIKQLLIKVLLSPAVKLGWDPVNGEDGQNATLREMLLVALVKLGHDKSINEGVRRFDILIHDHNTSILSPHTRRIPNQDAIHVLEFISIDARETSWSWLKENWDHILKVVPKSDLLQCIVNDIVPLFTSYDKAEEISKFITNYIDPKLQTVLKGNLKMVHINMRWIDSIRNEPKLAQTVHELLHKI